MPPIAYGHDWSEIPNPLPPPSHKEPWPPPVDDAKPKRGTYVGFKLPRWRRLVAEVIDYALPLLLAFEANTILGLAGLAFIFANSGFWQGLTGQSLGKRLVGIRLAYGVIWPGDNRVTFCYPGVVRTTGRLVIDAALGVMLLTTWPPLVALLLAGVLVGRYRRSLGDWCVKTLVVPPTVTHLAHKPQGQIAAMRPKNTWANP